EGNVRHFARQSFEREFFSKRKEWITVPHQDTAQIGMTVKLDSHHVVNLALMPVRGRPDVGNGIDRSGIFRQFELQSHMEAERYRIELVNDLETRFLAEIVDAGDVDQIVERKVVAAEFRDPTQIGGGGCIGGFYTQNCF